MLVNNTKKKYKLDLQMFTGEPDRVSIDLTQLSGYAALADGQYTLTVKAKATGYEDSAVSAGVSWTKTTPLPQLSAPEILSVTQDLVMTYTEVPNAEYYDIYVDGVLEESVPVVSGFDVRLMGAGGDGETVYIQINDDPTWYYADMGYGALDGFVSTNIPNAVSFFDEEALKEGFLISNVSKIKIGTYGNPASNTGPAYFSNESTGDLTNLTFTSTGGSAPAYATGEITMTQDSDIIFYGDYD